MGTPPIVRAGEVHPVEAPGAGAPVHHAQQLRTGVPLLRAAGRRPQRVLVRAGFHIHIEGDFTLWMLEP